MKANDRRKGIITCLLSENGAVSGGALAERFNVSRQIIVQDIAFLKSAGYEILSTHNGYVVQKSPHVERIFKLQHTKERTEDELNTIINYGGTVVDVFVWHKVYGKVLAKLNIYAKYQVDNYIENVRIGKSTELMDITGGYHYHTVRADSEKTLDLIEEKLQEKGFIILQEK